MKTISNYKMAVNAVVLLLTLAIQGHGQTLKSKSFIGVNANVSWLLGNVTKNDYYDPAAGFVQNPGNGFGIEGAYFFHANIGVGGLFNYATYSAKSDALAAGIDESYGTAAGQATIDPYKTYNFYVGPYVALPVTKWLTLDYSLLGGLATTVLPQISYSLLDEDDQGNPVSYNFSQNSSTKSAFGFTTGIGARVEVFKGISLTLKGNYFYSKPDFDVTYSGVQNVSPTFRNINSYNQPVTGFSINLGITYQFGN